MKQRADDKLSFFQYILEWLRDLLKKEQNLNNSKDDITAPTEPIIQTPSSPEMDIRDEMPDFLKHEDDEKNFIFEDVFPVKVGTNEKIPVSDVLKNDEQDEQRDEDNKQKDSIQEKRDEEKRDIFEADALLDNKPLVKLFKECTDVLNELDRIAPRFKSPDSEILLEVVQEKFYDALLLAGAKKIENDKNFDSLRHSSVDGLNAEEGTPIEETILPGIILEDRVFIKAKVKIKKENRNG